MDHVTAVKSGRAQVRESPSFAAFYALQYRSAATLATVLTGDPQRGADLAQEIFTIAFRRWDKISAYDRPDLWVRRAIVNRSISERRKRTSESRVFSRLVAGHNGAAPTEVVPLGLWRLVGKLPRRQAQVLALFYGDDLSIEDTARAMRCSVGAVKTHLHRGRTTLATLWRPTDES